MKKIFSIVALATLTIAGMSSCTNSEEDNVASGKTLHAIKMNVLGSSSPSTRGVATSAGNLQFNDFQTWGYDAVDGNIYMGTSETSGKTVTRSADIWGYDPIQFWPANALNFVAIAPNTANGVISNTVTKDGSNELTLTTSVSLPTNVTTQDDIMFAQASDITEDSQNGTVPFEFKHALSQIVFKGKLPSNGAITKVTISEITLGNICKDGDLTFTSNGDFFGGNEQVTASNPSNFTLDGENLEYSVYEVGDNGVAAGTAFDMTTSNSVEKRNAWFMLPQTTSAWIPNSEAELKAGVVTSDPTDGAYLKVRAKLEKDGVTVLNDNKAIYIPLSVNWDRSKKYIYTLDFNGTSALSPITFTVTAENWSEANSNVLSM
ncbi:MAG: fimbrillin family protein [Bacteroidaceae bacterium]|nr:fimbrillin family protein [Bacteroidaceae bacterium]